MRKTTLVIIIIIAILIVWLVFVNTPLSKPYNNWLLSRAIETKDTSFCEKMTKMGYVPGPVVHCYTQVALEHDDITVCDNLELNRMPGRRDCYIEFVLQKEDPSYCNESSVESIRDGCVETFDKCKDTPNWCGRK
jgi:hypothetical protein